MAAHLGFDRVLTSVGQVYPRSLDFDVVSALVQAAAGPSSLATTIRLMAGQELVTEGFQRRARSARQRHAAQDEHPVLRAGQRPGRGAAGLPVDGRRARRRPVERGRRLLLGRPPGRPARRVLRRRRAVPDLPHRARRVRRLPRGDRPRAGALPAVPGHHQGADGRRPQRRRARDRARGDQGARGRRGAGACGSRAPPRTTCSTGSPPTRGSGCPASSSTRWWPTRATFTGAAGAQVEEVVAQVEAVVARYPDAAVYRPAPIL